MDFIVGTGRSGTAFLTNMLNVGGGSDVAEHRLIGRLTSYVILRFAKKYYEQGGDAIEDVRLLLRCYKHRPQNIRIDIYSALAWIIPALVEAFPEARFMHLVRDPRTKILSAYNERDAYGETFFLPQYQRKMLEFAVENNDLRYFNLELERQMTRPDIKRPDWGRLDRFEKTCAHWTEPHRLILDVLPQRGADKYLLVRMEDLTTSTEVARRVFDFFGVKAPAEPDLKALISKKVNASGAAADRREWTFLRELKVQTGQELLPAYAEWTDEQKAALERICGPMARRLGYDV